MASGKSKNRTVVFSKSGQSHDFFLFSLIIRKNTRLSPTSSFSLYSVTEAKGSLSRSRRVLFHSSYSSLSLEIRYRSIHKQDDFRLLKKKMKTKKNSTSL